MITQLKQRIADTIAGRMFTHATATDLALAQEVAEAVLDLLVFPAHKLPQAPRPRALGPLQRDVLAALKARDEPVRLLPLTAQMGVHRASVWKALQRLKALDLAVETEDCAWVAKP